jgi:cyclopropane-fatty-acyl-phospholipid synthase
VISTAMLSREEIRSLGASAEAIQRHYDIGNEFFALWLDPTLSYSAALWTEDLEVSLEHAQLQKIDLHLRNARVANGASILDIGCGWGNVLQRATSQFGAGRAIGITLSRAQFDYIEQHANPRIAARLEHWLDHEPPSAYDALVCIEALDAFAKAGLYTEQKTAIYRHFFERCHRWLKPGGYMALQNLSYGNAPVRNGLAVNTLFPESDLPKLSEILSAMERLFEIVAIANDRVHYARTVRAWRNAMRRQHTYAMKIVGRDLLARFEAFLALSEFSLASGGCDLYRFTLRRVDRPRH